MSPDETDSSADLGKSLILPSRAYDAYASVVMDCCDSPPCNTYKLRGSLEEGPLTTAAVRTSQSAAGVFVTPVHRLDVRGLHSSSSGERLRYSRTARGNGQSTRVVANIQVRLLKTEVEKGDKTEPLTVS